MNQMDSSMCQDLKVLKDLDEYSPARDSCLGSECDESGHESDDAAVAAESRPRGVFEQESNSSVDLRTCQAAASGRLKRWYNHRGSPIVWHNVIALNILHCCAIYGIIEGFLIYQNWEAILAGYFYGVFAAVGTTAGAHRLWSHRSYKARLPFRIFLMLGHTAAGQGTLIEWCRDHRTHHKYTETDADPHDSRRGYFFSHVGWLLTRKHPEVIRKGKQIDISDLWADPVVRFQYRYFPVLAFLWCILLPGLFIHRMFAVPLGDAIIGAGFWRYITGLHSTWFVNSAAHMWGDKPYNHKIAASENWPVVFASFGEGFHNYHHTFPSDWRASETPWTFNLSGAIIWLMARVGLAYDLRYTPADRVAHHKIKTNHRRFGHDGIGY